MTHDNPQSRREEILRLASDALARRTRRRRVLQSSAAAVAILAAAAGASWLAKGGASTPTRVPEHVATQHEQSTPPEHRPPASRHATTRPLQSVVEFTVITSRDNALVAYAATPPRATVREPVIIHTLSDDDLLQALASAGHTGVALAHAPSGSRLLNVRLDPPPAPKPPSNRGS